MAASAARLWPGGLQIDATDTQPQSIEDLTLSSRDSELFVSCRPSADQAPIDPQSLRRLIDDAGYAGWALLPDALAALAKGWAAGADAFELLLGRREDARFTVEVANNKMSAWLNLTAARGGESAKLEDVQRALTDAGVMFGIDQAALQEACASSVDGRFLVASAVAAVKGDDTRFELLVSDTRDRTPQVDENGLIDYHELGDIPIVNAEQALMRRHPPTPGINGHDVCGGPLYAKPGLDEPFDAPFVSTVLSDTDPNLLLAQDAGLPVRTRCGVHVEQVLRMKNVNLATGNVHFVGTVEVTGDVSPGMKVDATGDIVVKGMVDGARLDAGGSIHVAGGVIAHATVRAVNSVSVHFVENSTLNAGTTIAIENMALHSELQALNQVLVGTEAGQRGRLIGGSTRATMLIRTPVLGAAAGGLTKVQVGVNPALEARQQELVQNIEHEKVEADKLEKLLHHLTQHGDPRQMLEKVRAAWQHRLKDWGHLLEEKVEVDRELALTQAARIEVLGGVSGDVNIAFGKVIRQLRSGLGAGAFSLDDHDQVVFIPSDGQAAVVL